MPTIYDKYRKRPEKKPRTKKKLGLGWSLSLIVIAELFVCLCLTSIFSYLVAKRADEVFSIPMIILITISGTLIGSAMSVFLNRALLSPIRKLSQAMTEVTNGSFDVQLEPNSRFGDIETIYQDFNLMTSELAATEILKTDFVSNVSHEIKTPITIIDANAELIEIENGESEWTEGIKKQTKRLVSLTEKLVNLTRM